MKDTDRSILREIRESLAKLTDDDRALAAAYIEGMAAHAEIVKKRETKPAEEQ